jgi:hypothetical protein
MTRILCLMPFLLDVVVSWGQNTRKKRVAKIREPFLGGAARRLEPEIFGVWSQVLEFLDVMWPSAPSVAPLHSVRRVGNVPFLSGVCPVAVLLLSCFCIVLTGILSGFSAFTAGRTRASPDGSKRWSHYSQILLPSREKVSAEG